MSPCSLGLRILYSLVGFSLLASAQAHPSCTTMVPITPYKVTKGEPQPVTLTDVEVRLDDKPVQVVSIERDLTPLRAIFVLDGSGSMAPESSKQLGSWHLELYVVNRILAQAGPGSKFGLLRSMVGSTVHRI